tara:strand:- start:61 stop:243 length:183 start_codon:yes stop_codon:yes gene_type:complete
MVSKKKPPIKGLSYPGGRKRKWGALLEVIVIKVQERARKHTASCQNIKGYNHFSLLIELE